jgi:imidazolonepropionase-like amidohydrolase
MVLAGSDAIPFPPLGVTEELWLLVEAGLPPLAALQAATINAARAMRMEDRLGSVEEGKLADLLLLDANPLHDIRNVRTVNAVVTNGRLLDRATLDRLLARLGTPASTTPPGQSRPERR